MLLVQLIYPAQYKTVCYLNWIGDDQQSWFLEFTLFIIGLIGKSSRSPPTWSSWDSTSVVSELNNCSLTVRSRWDNLMGYYGKLYHDISRVLNWGDSSSSKFDLLPGLFKVDNPCSLFTLMRDILFHMEIQMLRTDMSLKHKHRYSLLRPTILRSLLIFCLRSCSFLWISN